MPPQEHPVAMAIHQDAAKKKSPKWLEPALFGALGLAVGADVGSTIGAMEHGIKEGNPVMRPLAKLGPAGMILGGAVPVGASMLIAHHLKKKKVPAWWVEPLLGTVVHSVAAGLNARAIKRAR